MDSPITLDVDIRLLISNWENSAAEPSMLKGNNVTSENLSSFKEVTKVCQDVFKHANSKYETRKRLKLMKGIKYIPILINEQNNQSKAHCLNAFRKANGYEYRSFLSIVYIKLGKSEFMD
eukprot:NODE_35_length_31537_cov_0.293403.p19 type:complete len:120 gc:universal NODE_35_length_31537_cov_0.293403:18177-17818(-)